MGEYLLRCVSDGSVQPDHSLSCPNDNSLLRADYLTRQIVPKRLPGIWKFLDWLPVKGPMARTEGGPVTYKSQGLARELGLEKLFISFNGFWPEKGAALPTGSFKDLEAAPTIQRLRERGDCPTLVVASAGNTARAFAHISILTGHPLLLFVPEKALFRMWTVLQEDFGAELNHEEAQGQKPVASTLDHSDPLRLIAVRGDYYDAISIAEKLQSQPGFVPEGGARNIARRDGMGTVMLDCALYSKALPKHYFQAVGSGTGGISAWEASLRLIRDGRFGNTLPILHLAQNVPNAPIFYAWKGREPDAVTNEMFDDVLFNRKPPYAIPGGVKDALQETKGEVYGVTDRQAEEAKKLFEESEEIDILNAPAIAVAALQEAVSSGAVQPKESVLLNITGGGLARMKETFSLRQLKPQIVVSQWQEAAEFLEAKI
jgi:cysteate synthase